VSGIAASGANAQASRERATFPRSIRLLRHSDFERVYKLGRRHFAVHVTAFYLTREHGKGLRVGFTVGKSLGGAVQRNAMKRRLREAVRLQHVCDAGPFDVVINPKKSLVNANFAELRDEIDRVFEVIRKSAAKP
jgi:ribonuclease P protein component